MDVNFTCYWAKGQSNPTTTEGIKSELELDESGTHRKILQPVLYQLCSYVCFHRGHQTPCIQDLKKQAAKRMARKTRLK